MPELIHLPSTEIRELAALREVALVGAWERRFIRDLQGRTVLTRRQWLVLRQIRLRYRRQLEVTG